MKKNSFGLWRNHSSLVSYNLTVVVGTSAVPTAVTVQALDVNGNTLAEQSNLKVRLTTGVLPYVDSTNGAITVATGTVLVEDEHTTVAAGITAGCRVVLQSDANGKWSFTVANATVAQLMGLILGPCYGCARAGFHKVYTSVAIGAGAATIGVATGGVAAVTFKHAT